MAVYDVPAAELIQRVAEDLRKELQQPGFTPYVKTGVGRERSPQNKDWWFVRSASILYRLYKDGPAGTEGLRSYYGGRKNRGLKPERFRKASGKVIRTCLQALEKSGYIKKVKKGRVVSQKGQGYLEKKAEEIKKHLTEILQQKEEAELRVEKEKQLSKEELELRETFRKQKEEEKRHEAEKHKKEGKPQPAKKPEEGKAEQQ
ncbi:MAG: 30S ribosomal protein S19e [Candidatus Diapherotrites archaeon]|uniref:Small ribosomal subunit protein eS19 n=1 Tax=Candidatus Iainarchaeum sp. TaxID=3101447 RepID=A0A8T4L7M1_9ARCH|nr:30S ribosomal protein S19e [Candidatus Diapherotrites archaeon]